MKQLPFLLIEKYFSHHNGIEKLRNKVTVRIV